MFSSEISDKQVIMAGNPAIQMVALDAGSKEMSTLLPSAKLKLNSGSSVASLGKGFVPHMYVTIGSILVPSSSSKTNPHPSSPVRSLTVARVEQAFFRPSSEHCGNRKIISNKAIKVFIRAELSIYSLRHT